MPYTIPPGIALDIPDINITITPQSEYKVTIQAVDTYHSVLVQNTTSTVTRNASIFVDVAASASYATTASFAIVSAGTASNAVTADSANTASYVSTTIGGGVGLPIITGSVILSGSTATNLFGVTERLGPPMPTGSYLGCNVDYRAWRSGSARQGLLLATWLGSGSNQINFTDAACADIGDTSDISFDFVLDGESAHLRITSTGSGPSSWTVQTFFKMFPIFPNH